VGLPSIDAPSADLRIQMREDSKIARILANRLTKPDVFVKEDILPKSVVTILNGSIGDMSNKFAT
jgi:hypothetical protein